MQLPSAKDWHETPDGPDKDGEVDDCVWAVICQLCQQVEALEDEVARLRK